MAQTKYRPSLAAEHIQWLVEHCRREAVNDHVALDILTVLAPFKAKVDAGAITPAYTTKPKQTLLQQLGEAPPTPEYKLKGESYSSKETYWEACYELTKRIDWQLYVSPAELKAIQAGAKEHRYLHGLMTDEEVAAFEEASFLAGDDTNL